ncbi:MAG: glycosyltransferase family 39 protein [Deltaproteobacteria bacterium]|nr:glycosyltransferase family 39 protein [Deltaproteobacteria bacterium]
MSFFKNKSTIAIPTFVFLLFVYHANKTVIEEGDAIANTTLPIALLKYGSLSFTPETSPRSFSWIVAGQDIEKPFITTVHSWDEILEGKTYREWQNMGHVKLRKPAYYITWSEKRQVYVNTYGPVSGLTLLPLSALLYFVDRNIGEKEELLLSAAKLHASALVAISAIFIFLIAARFVSTGQALLITFSYALGTCVWSISSQNIWQQTVNLFFIVIGIYFLIKVEKHSAFGALSGLMFGAAMACRMTSLLLLVSVFVYLCIYHRRSAVYFALTSALFPACIAWYNYYFFDSPFTFGQSVVGKELALEKTGIEDVWQTPLWYGALGQLISPSRGLFVFSPFLAFSLWGIFRIWCRPIASLGAANKEAADSPAHSRTPAEPAQSERAAPDESDRGGRRLSMEQAAGVASDDRRIASHRIDTNYRVFRPLTVGAIAIACMQFKWFDWWGGWTYGYRPLVDLVPLLMIFMIPVISVVVRNKLLLSIYSVTLAWSVFVQALGAMSYDKAGWNERLAYTVVLPGWDRRILFDQDEAMRLVQEHGGEYVGTYGCNMDYQFCRHRLWSITDNQIWYYITHYSEARKKRVAPGWDQLSIFTSTLQKTSSGNANKAMK